MASVAIMTMSVAPASAATGPAGQVFTLLNQQRAANGLPALVSDPTLDAAAQAWAQHLAAAGIFEHSTSDWRNSMIGAAGWVYSGENIAAGYNTPSSVMVAWMNSAGHRANILSSGYDGVGVGFVTGGPYGYYWVQIFAKSTMPSVVPGSAPVVSGNPALGSPLTASTSGWAGGTTLTWSWQSGGAPIPGAAGASYIPTLSDLGRSITATVTGSRSGYRPATATSAGTGLVAGNVVSQRISGADRYATAVAISVAGFAPGVPVVYIASGNNFPDALAAAPAASLLGGPLLLTPPDHLPASVLTELTRLQPGRIVVAGGTSAVSDTVLEQLGAVAPTSRIAGDDRYATSRALVDDAFDTSTIAYVATGLNFPDALTAGAAAASIDAPVLLVYGLAPTVDPETLDLLTALGVTTVRIAGSTTVVSQGIQNQLTSAGFTVQRAAGADRFDTAAAVNAQAFTSESKIYLALAFNFPDALAGAALAGSLGAPMYISTGTCIPASIERGMTALNPSTVVLLGGPTVLSSEVASYRRC